MNKRLVSSQFEKSSDSLGFSLWRTFHVWQRNLRAQLAILDLTQVQFTLLATTDYLGKQGSAPSQQDLAEATGMDKMMVSEVTRTLEKKGWIQREPHPSDGRAFCLQVTADGVRLLKKAVPTVEAADQEFFSVCTEKDQKALLKILNQLAERK